MINAPNHKVLVMDFTSNFGAYTMQIYVKNVVIGWLRTNFLPRWTHPTLPSSQKANNRRWWRSGDQLHYVMCYTGCSKKCSLIRWSASITNACMTTNLRLYPKCRYWTMQWSHSRSSIIWKLIGTRATTMQCSIWISTRLTFRLLRCIWKRWC